MTNDQRMSNAARVRFGEMKLDFTLVLTPAFSPGGTEGVATLLESPEALVAVTASRPFDSDRAWTPKSLVSPKRGKRFSLFWGCGQTLGVKQILLRPG
jgi:hypothetical protein